MNEIVTEMNYEVRNWWASLLLGVLFLLVAVGMLLAPQMSLITLGAIFSVAIFVSGALELAFVVGNRRTLAQWGWYLAGAILDMLAGLYLIAYPWVSVGLVPLLLGFWLLYRGFVLCGYAVELRRYRVRGRGWYLAFGVLAVVCALALLWRPMFAGQLSVWLLACTLGLMGLFRIALALELRRLQKKGG